MRILGIDYGRKRLGLARSDEEGVLASPLPLYTRGRSSDDDLDRLADLARREGVARIVVGWPLHMDGTEGEMAAEVRAFSEELRTRTGLPVDLYDERWTSAQADAAMVAGDLSRRRRRQLRDGLSATLILQGFLDRERAA
ncbi:MAG: Holliday junction resolvase RuvX [Candidatus Bipolaricaulis sp.]|nr:Holliday junction resolvase RuvX [Candidatus Bipolaricaulis sp.]MDD5219112.1 Holliday junction resolvase RuvX [Candidatus Bipolaricaulis sp.]MDD5647059.1 Holliday junction resolvase RuvX [Candidatus Bipolaricaulis sp.]